MRSISLRRRFATERNPGIRREVPEYDANQVLARLPSDSRERIASHLQREELPVWKLIAAEQEPITRVYFPVDAVISVVSSMEDGSIVEAYTAGRDGMCGSEIVWGEERSIFRAMCQIPGVVYGMDAGVFRSLCKDDRAVLDATHAYAHCVLGLTGRSAGCNMLHPVVQRCARWLLISHDRVRKDTFELTQDVLATMLGVHRPAVSIAAGTLQKAGLISYTRGRITIKDRAGLEEASCECYDVVAREYERVLGFPKMPA